MTDNAVAKQLAQQVLETNRGITPEQLKALLEAEVSPTPPTPTPQATVEPAPAPAPQAPAAQPVKTEPAQGAPNVLDLIPEQFRSTDVPTSLQKITKSYSDLESDLKKQKDEVANLNKLVQSFINREPEPSIPQMAQPPAGEVDDSQFFERPTEAVKKIAAQVAAAQVLAYHTTLQRQKSIDTFKAAHPDFESYREDMLAILRARPDLDKDERNLPMVFELAKQRSAQKMADLRQQLGLQPPAAVPTAPVVDIEAISKIAYEKARDAIIAEITQRRSASGIQGGSPPVTPEDRVQPRVTEKVLSAEDAILQEMLNSGPKKLTLGE